MNSKVEKLRLVPVFAAAVIVSGISLLFRVLATRLCGGEFIYPIDDTYIHIAMAKNIIDHGVWGVETDALAFCSSSPLWTVLLVAIYRLVGFSEQIPWWLAHFFNLGGLFVFDRLLMRCGMRGVLRLLSDLALAVAGPFFCTTALGMEHSMHAFFLLATLSVLFAEGHYSVCRLAGVSLLAFCATASRYESLFLLWPLFLGVGIVKRDWRIFVPMLVAGFPVAVYGCLAMAYGGLFLPNSLVLKGCFLSPLGVLKKFSRLLVSIPLLCEYLYAMMIALMVIVILPGVKAFWRAASLAVVFAIVGHLVFAQVIRQLCRYEAYLMVMGMASVLCAVSSAVRGRRIVDCLLLAVPLLTCVLLCARASLEVPYVVAASEDIYSQQVQMTRMMAALPEIAKGRVAINDLGYFSLHSGLPVYDMLGLGTQEVADAFARQSRGGAPYTMIELTDNMNRAEVRFGVFFEKLFPEMKRPKDFKPVGYLLLYGNRICGFDIVTFCVRREEDVAPLREHLSKFVNRLPRRARLEL